MKNKTIQVIQDKRGEKMFKIIITIMIILMGVIFYFYPSNTEDKKVLLSKPMVEKIVKTSKTVEHNVTKKIVKVTKVFKEKNETQEALKFCLKSKQGRFSWQKYTFDSQGRVTAVTSDRNRDGKAESKSFLTYDENGNPTDVITETYQDILTEISESHREYDEQNRLISKEFEKNGFSRGQTYEYNEKNDLVRVTSFRNGNIGLDVAVLNDYDEHGRLISKKFKYLDSDGKTLSVNGEFTNKEYKYNEKGQLIEMKDPSYARVVKYIYNVLGEKIKEETYLKTIDKGVHLYSFITYKYDKYGNLIEKRDKYGKIVLKQEFGICGE